MKKPELIFGQMTYEDMMHLRLAYIKGCRTKLTRQANALYARVKRRGWLDSLKARYGNKKELQGEG